MGKEKKQPRECAYCGEIKMPTDDHVIPQCLFNKPLPGNMIVVEACQECNSLKSKDDDYLRDYLVTHLSTYEQEVPKRLFEGKMSRSIQRNSSSFAKEIKTSKTTNTPFFLERGEISSSLS